MSEAIQAETQKASDAPGYDAFISYRRSDEKTARGVFKLLEAFGQKVFFDDHLQAGDVWADRIWEALRVSRRLIVLWSRNASASDEVRAEWTRAPTGCRVFALRLDKAVLPANLGQLQRVDGFDVATRLLARTEELIEHGNYTRKAAQEKLIEELTAEHALDAKQKDALSELVPLLVLSFGWWRLAMLAALGWTAAASVVFVAGAGAGYYLKGLEQSIAPEPAPTAKAEPPKVEAGTAGSSSGAGLTIPAGIGTAPSCDAEHQATIACERQLASAKAAASRAGTLKDQVTAATRRAEQAEAVAGATEQTLVSVNKELATAKGNLADADKELDTLEARMRSLQTTTASCEAGLRTAKELNEELKRKSDGLGKDVVEARRGNEILRARNDALTKQLTECSKGAGPG